MVYWTPGERCAVPSRLRAVSERLLPLPQYSLVTHLVLHELQEHLFHRRIGGQIGSQGVPLLREALPAEGLEAALARGAELDLEQVVEEILAGDE